MRILVITGDPLFKVGNQRFDIQAAAVEKMEVVYFGPGALTPHLSEGPFDVVTAQDPFFRGVFGWFAAKRYRARFNVQVHADIAAQSFIKRILAYIVLRRANSIRVVSEKIKEQVERIGAKVPITVLPIFVPLEQFKNINRMPDVRPLILWVGRFEDEKNPLEALDVLKAVREKGIDAQMVLLGEGSLEARLRRASSGLPVEFPGWQDPVPYLMRAQVVLSTSRSESWGASIIEALTAGVPVVAPDVGIAKEAGAIVVSHEKLSNAVDDVLRAPRTALLALPLLSESEWVTLWRASLV